MSILVFGSLTLHSNIDDAHPMLSTIQSSKFRGHVMVLCRPVGEDGLRGRCCRGDCKEVQGC